MATNQSGTKTLTDEEIEEYVRSSIQRPPDSSDEVVLIGKITEDSMSYDEYAESEGYTHFHMEDEEYDEVLEKYGHENVWRINKRFLQIYVDKNATFKCTHEPNHKDFIGSTYEREIKFLIDNNYEFTKDGDLWVGKKRNE